jgi:hypothetical protein
MMAPKTFSVDVSQEIYEAAAKRARGEGKSLDTLLTDYLKTFAGPGSSQSQQRYTVQSGDTLSKIARQFYGDPYKYTVIQQANNLDNAGRIWVGQVLVIPAVSGTATTSLPASSTTTAPSTSNVTSSASTGTSASSSGVIIKAPEPEPMRVPVENTTPANPSLLNGGFETFQPRIKEGKPSSWREFPEEYGEHWSFKLVSERKDNRTRVMSSPVFGQFAQRYFGGGGLNYAYGGGNSQVITSRYGFEVVFRQTVAAQPGRTYTFTGLIVSFFKGTDNPATPGKIFKTLGIDPTGGTDYKSASIVWGNRIDTDHAWINPSIQAQAQANAITVFIRLESVEKDVGETELNIIHLDRFELK